jgi:hypothetical protein
MSALRWTADAQSRLQEQFDRHKCEPEGSSEAHARGSADLLLRQEPDEEEDEAEDDRKEADGSAKKERPALSLMLAVEKTLPPNYLAQLLLTILRFVTVTSPSSSLLAAFSS